MKKYWRHIVLAIEETIAYRNAYIINIISRFTFYFVIFLVWGAVYGGATSVAGYSWPEMQGYLLISLFSSALVSPFSEFRISRSIRSGNIAVELMRPVDYQKASLSITIGNSVTEGLLISFVGIIFAAIVGTFKIPGDILTWGLFLVSIILSFLTKFLITFVFSLAAFWTNTMMGISWLRQGLTDFFSGAIIPLSFFPVWLKTTADWLPFRGIAYVPGTIFIGKLPVEEALRSFTTEIAWIIGLWFLAKFIWRFAMRKVTVQGG